MATLTVVPTTKHMCQIDKLAVSLNAPITVNQPTFLNNRKHKAQRIPFLEKAFEHTHFYRTDNDADYSICQLTNTQTRPVARVGNDTDLMIILTHSLTK